MKRLMMLSCAAAAALFMTADTASAQCGYGGGYYGGPGISIGYSSFSPRTSFSIGYNSFPARSFVAPPISYRSRGFYSPAGVSRYRSSYRVHPGYSHFYRSRHRW